MRVAQQLYEGLDMGREGLTGLITYMRTDSTRISDTAQSAVRDYIAEAVGSEYVPQKPPTYKISPRAQEAHEAIRPTEITRTPKQIKDAPISGSI